MLRRARNHNTSRLTRHAITARLRAIGIRQYDIAKRIGCSQSQVSRVICRTAPPSDMTEAIWRHIEGLLEPGQAA